MRSDLSLGELAPTLEGGPPGYPELLAGLDDPSYPDHEELKEWAPTDFDPDHFDPDEASLAMRSPRPLEGW